MQSRDLAQTRQFINALLSKEDIKSQDKAESSDPPKTQINGNVSFRSDGSKTRFSEPPAPPPSQPLPEKPDISRPVSSDVPSKRASAERPKPHPSNTSPVRSDSSFGQIAQLTEALSNAKKELDSHTARVRVLEEELKKEREARFLAEEVLHKMEENDNHPTTNGVGPTPLVNGHSELEHAFEPPVETTRTAEMAMDFNTRGPDSPSQPDKIEAMAAAYQAQIDAVTLEMADLRELLEASRQRAERAEAERDADRKTLAEMVLEIRRRDEQDKKATEQKMRSPSLHRSRSRTRAHVTQEKELPPLANGDCTAEAASNQSDGSVDDPATAPTLSRANTITPSTGVLAIAPQDPALIVHALPYASMLGVVFVGMGLMAYLNGWQPHPRLSH